MSLRTLQEHVQEAIKCVTKKILCRLLSLRNKYRKFLLVKDAIVENVVDNFIINLGGADSSDTNIEYLESFMSDFLPL
jgi:hypothetical protein